MVVPGKWAERCTWVCHTQTVLWWCTGKWRRWCSQLGWTPAASDPRLAQPSEQLSGRRRWTPEGVHSRYNSQFRVHVHYWQRVEVIEIIIHPIGVYVCRHTYSIIICIFSFFPFFVLKTHLLVKLYHYKIVMGIDWISKIIKTIIAVCSL